MRMVAEAPSIDVTLSLQARGQSIASWAEIGTLSRHDLRFYTNDAYRMALDTNGNVGVGTMGPAARLPDVRARPIPGGRARSPG